MLSIMVAMMLSMAAKDPLEAPRNAYSKCLGELRDESAKKKQSVDDFKAAAEAACQIERQAFADAVYKSENPANKKSLDADAKARGEEEVTWAIESVVDAYTGMMEEGSQ